jgi:hypothetical protein
MKLVFYCITDRMKGSLVMANRAKSLTKKSAVANKAEEVKKGIVCNHPDCEKKGILQKETNFYLTNSSMMNRFPICKNCIQKIVDPNNIETVYKILKEMNIGFDSIVWNASLESNPIAPFGVYLRQMNTLSQNVGSSWNQSTENKQDEEITKQLENTDLSKLKEKYGYGFTPEEYLNFERKYKKLSRGYKEKTELHTERLLTYIIHKVKGEMAAATGGNVSEAEKWEKLAQSDATAAKLNVSQLSKSDITGGIDLLPQLVEAVEQYASLIPLLPKVLEQPYDDADLIIWANINYTRRLEDKPIVSYREIWNFYDKMLEENYKQKGYSDEQIKSEKTKRNNVFRDLSEVYIEPLYENPDEFIEENGDSDEFS